MKIRIRKRIKSTRKIKSRMSRHGYSAKPRPGSLLSPTLTPSPLLSLVVAIPSSITHTRESKIGGSLARLSDQE
jgi:hypothetical protein